MNDLVDRICARRPVSPKQLMAPGPTQDELREMARTAAAAPDHGRLGPMRLVHIPDDRREPLADVFAVAALEAEPQSDATRIEDTRQRSRNGACLIAVIANLPPSPKSSVPNYDECQILVACGWCNNFLTRRASDIC